MQNNNTGALQKKIPSGLILIFLVLTCLIGATGYYYYYTQKQHLRQAQNHELSAIADLKASQIQTWREERIADAEVFFASPLFTDSVKRFFKEPDTPNLKEDILRRLEVETGHRDYINAYLLDSAKRVRIAVHQGNIHLRDYAFSLAARTLKTKKIIFSDMHRGLSGDSIHIDLVIPLLSGGTKSSQAIGVVILQIDPERFLDPLIQTWPTPSPSGETLLVRREGEWVTYLNELRHKKNTALTLKYRADADGLPAAMAVRGQTGIAEGVDYRGIPVLAAIRQIPDSGWFLVAKIDTEEVDAPIRRLALYVAMIVIALILVAVLAVAFMRLNERMHAEVVLRESESRYRLLFENMLHGFAYCRMLYDDQHRPMDFIYLDVNSAFEKLTGLKNVKGKKVSEIIPGLRDSNPELFDIYGRVALTGQPEQFETELAVLGIWFSVSVYSPKREHFVAVFDNITERKRAEQALRVSEERFRFFVDTSLIGILFGDTDGHVYDCNEELARIIGRSRQDVLDGKINWADITPPEDLPLDEKAIAEAQLTGRCTPYEKHYLRPDGTRVPIVVGFVLLPPDRHRSVAFLLDITKRKRAETAVRLSEERYHMLFKTMTDGFAVHEIICNDQGAPINYRFVEVNQNFERLTGLKRDAIVGKTALDILPNIEQYWIEQYGKVALTGEPTSFENYSRELNKYFSVTAYSPGKGQFAVVFSDITERKLHEDLLKKMAEDLTRSNKELEQFAYIASHDLQEPLRMVASYVQLLERRYKGQLDSNADEFIGYAVDGAVRMQRMINDLLVYSRIGTKNKTMEPVDSTKVLVEVLTDLKLHIEETRANIIVDTMPVVTANATELAQVFQNLISNAIKFRGSRPPEIHIRAEQNEHAWRFSVKDNGIGLAPEYADKIFILFKRLHSAAQYPGSGIGLTICKKIVERHHGRIWVESEPGKGATFFFTIPITSEAG